MSNTNCLRLGVGEWVYDDSLTFEENMKRRHENPEFVDENGNELFASDNDSKKNKKKVAAR